MLGADNTRSRNLSAVTVGPGGYEHPVGCYRPEPAPNDIDVVIDLRGPIAPQEMCIGLMAPIAVFDDNYSFGRDAIIKAIHKLEKIADKQSGPAAPNSSFGNCECKRSYLSYRVIIG